MGWAQLVISEPPTSAVSGLGSAADLLRYAESVPVTAVLLLDAVAHHQPFPVAAVDSCVVHTVAVTETVKVVAADGSVLSTPDRSALRSAAFPTAARAELWIRACRDGPVTPADLLAALVRVAGGVLAAPW